MAFTVAESKALAEFQQRHALDPSIIEQLLETHNLDSALIDQLLDLAYTKYRTLSAWGGKAEFSREIDRIIREASSEGSGGSE